MNSNKKKLNCFVIAISLMALGRADSKEKQLAIIEIEFPFYI